MMSVRLTRCGNMSDDDNVRQWIVRIVMLGEALQTNQPNKDKVLNTICLVVCMACMQTHMNTT